MAIYLGDNGARITYSSQPVYFGGQKIKRIYVGDALIYPDGMPEYKLAEWYSFPEQERGEGTDRQLINESGTFLKVNNGANLVDGVIYLGYDSSWEEANTDTWKYAYSYGIAIKGTNITSVEVCDFSGYYGKFVVRAKAEGWNDSFHWKSSGSYTIWTSYIVAVLFLTSMGDVMKDMAVAHSSDLREVSSSEFYRFYSGK